MLQARFPARILAALLIAPCGCSSDQTASGHNAPFTLDAGQDTAPLDQSSPPDAAVEHVGSDTSVEGNGGSPADAAPESPEDVAAEEALPPCGASGEPCCGGYQCNSGLACTGATCSQAVTPAACTPGAPQAMFVAEQAPPLALEPWQTVLATVTFANCSGATWTSTGVNDPNGFKLGSWNPQDNDTWGASRVALPADVPTGSQVTVAVSVHAPPLTGSFGYGWAIVHEGAAWLSEPSPSHTITVQAAAGTATLCAGVQADSSGGASASVEIQQCIDATPAGGTLELPAGIYRITSEISINKPMTLRTAGTAGNSVGCLDAEPPKCAVLRADDNLNVPRGFLRLGTTNAVAIDHIVLDGNRSVRLGSAAAAQCAGGNNGPGFNASTPACTGCSFLRSGSVRALCGTGFEWRGDQATIEGSVFQGNGEHAQKNMWSDGLTVHQSDGAVIRNNRFSDNSDVGFIIGGGKNATIEKNYVLQIHQAAFAGLMLDNFDGGVSGDFTGTTVSENVVVCGNLQCDFAIQLGPHPWYLSVNIIGGTVTNNSAVGGKFNINAEGAGTTAAPTVVTQNTIGPSPAQATFNCGTRPSTAFNVSPDSHVDVGSGPAPTGSFEFHLCP